MATVARTSAASYGVAACGIVFGFAWMIQRAQVLIHSIPEEELEWQAVPASWACLCLFAVHAVALVMAARSVRQARPALLLSLTLMTVVAVIDNAALAQLMGQTGWSPTASVAAFWEATVGLRWSAWLAFNGWFFLRPRAQ